MEKVLDTYNEDDFLDIVIKALLGILKCMQDRRTTQCLFILTRYISDRNDVFADFNYLRRILNFHIYAKAYVIKQCNTFQS